jgi:transcription antitermination factor NusG
LHTENEWNAIRVRYRHEKMAADLLALKGFEIFLPTYRELHQWKDRKREVWLPLFPGYLFIENAASRKLQIVNTPGVCSIICTGGAPAVVAEEEILSIRRAVESTYSVEPHPFLTEGDVVCVKSGPLAGIDGILIRKKKDVFRLVISVRMLGRSAAVEIDASNLERTQGSSDRSYFLAPAGTADPRAEDAGITKAVW